MKDRLLTEIGGRILSPLNNNNLPIDIPQFQGLELQSRGNWTKSYSSINDLDSWQQELYNYVVHGQDVLVNVNPAGGKTKPIVFAWEDTFTGTGNDKIIWITPTVQLANQVFHTDLKSSILNKLKQWSENPNSSRFPTHLLPVEIQHIMAYQHNPNYELNSRNIQLDANAINVIRYWLENTAMALRTGSGKQGEITNETIATVCTYEYAPDIIDKQHPKFIIIDELQEYVPIEPDDKERQASKFISILRNIPHNSVFVLLTGSMNYSTAEQIVKFIYTRFGRRLIVFPKRENTPVAKNRAHIQITPHTKMNTFDDKIKIIKNCIFNRSVGNAMVMFSVKSNEPEFLGKNGIYPLAKQLTLELPARTLEQVCGIRTENNSPFNPHPYDTYNNPRYFTNLNNAAKFLSKNPESPQEEYNHLTFMLSQTQNQMGVHSSDNPEPLCDPFLGHCILCGFGYLAGGKLKGFRMHNEDIMLVQNLFKQGKIYFLLATDMIGVGTTLTIRTLYLPTLNKPKSGGLPYGQINDSSLVQLINRVGRQSNVAATIYCHPNDYEDINRLLYNDPSSEVQPALFGNGQSDIERQYSLVDTVKMIFNVLHSRLR